MDRVLGPRAELDFSTYVAERTLHFTGRGWILAEIERWRADPEAPRTFLLTGDPGVGKTAFAAHLVRDRPAWLAAWHFCSATRGGWIDPVECARSLAQQLAVRSPAFREALVRREGEHIRGEVSIGTQLGGLAVGVLIERFEAAGVEDAFNRLVRAPLLELEAAGQGSDLTLLVDGLDESLAYSGPVSIADLLARAADLPRFVRWILTSRDERRVLRLWEGVPHLRIHAEGDQNMADVRCFVGQRLERILGEDGAWSRDDVVERVAAKSAGNFLYVSHLMETLARQPAALKELDDLPEGLDGIYRAFLNREAGRDLSRWEGRYLPILGILTVAREPLAEERIAALAKRSRQEVAGALRDLWQYLSVEPGEELRVRIYHRSFIDFLLDRSRARDYWIDARDAHRRMVDALDPRRPDGYTLRHLAAHLAEAGLEEALFDLVDNPDWARRKLELDPSGRALAADVEIALEEAGRQGRQGVARLIACSLLYAELAERVSSIPPEALAALVKLGEVQRALDTAGLLVSAANRVRALGAIARSLGTRGDHSKAREIWRQAAATADSVGNSQAAVSVYLSLARNLVEGGEPELAAATLSRAEKACERLEIQGSLALRLEVSVLWQVVGNVAASDAVFSRACREAETVRQVSVYGDISFDHVPESGWKKITGDLRQELLTAAVPALSRLTNHEVRARWRERLRQVGGTPQPRDFEETQRAGPTDAGSQEAVDPPSPADLLLPPEHVKALRMIAREPQVPSAQRWQIGRNVAFHSLRDRFSRPGAALRLAATSPPFAEEGPALVDIPQQPLSSSFLARAWEEAGRIEHNDLRVDTICELLRESLARGSREVVLQSAHAARASLESLWAAAEKVRGWAVLASALAWAGEMEQAQDLREWAAGQAAAVLREESEASTQALTEAFGKLIAQGHSSEALEILTRVASALGTQRSSTILQSLGETALVAGDREAYGRLLALESDPGWNSRSFKTWRKAEISEKAALDGIQTAFGAARFLGTRAVWGHVRDLAELLRALDPEIATRLERYVDAGEAVLAALQSA